MPRKKTATEVPSGAAAAPATPAKVTLNTRMVSGGGFDIFAQKSKDKEQRKALLAKIGMADGFKTAAQLRREQLPIPWLSLQYLIGRPGFPVKTIIEFLGEENTSKSSLVTALACHWVKNNIPCYIINTEAKALETDWIMHLASTDPTMAAKIADCLEISEQTYTLTEMDTKLRTWVKAYRVKQGLPKEIPLVVIVDTITNLMNDEEAAINYTSTSKTATATLDKTINDISARPGVTAKWHQMWVRQLNKICNDYNVTIICVSGTNVDMDAGMFASKKKNKVKTGGVALNKETSFQITVTNKGDTKATDVSGRDVLLYCHKNSYGPVQREMVYTIITENLVHDESYYQFPLRLDYAGAQMLAKKKILGITCSDNLFSSDQLDIYQYTAEDLMNYINEHDDIKVKIWTLLGMTGFSYTTTPTEEEHGEETDNAELS